MLYPYYFEAKDDSLNVELFEGEFFLEISVEGRSISVQSVFLHGKDLFRGGHLARSIALEVSNAAESDANLIDTVLQSEGWTYTGLGFNDPDVRMERRFS